MPTQTDWNSIGCNVGYEHPHETTVIDVDLFDRHGYLDYAPIPERFTPQPFKMEVWNWQIGERTTHPTESEWCPVIWDPISEAVAEHGVWEPPETIALLELFEVASLEDEPWTFVDIGAQLGWYSILAAQYGLPVYAVEADPEVAAILDRNLTRITDDFTVSERRIGPRSRQLDLATPLIVKMDIEGAEPSGMRLIRPCLEAGLVRAAMIELTPAFGVDTDSIIHEMMDDTDMVAGFMPPKRLPPLQQETLADLRWVDDADKVAAEVGETVQTNLLFVDSSLL